MPSIINGDCVEILSSLPAESVDLVFADPPFNIGFQYDEYKDTLTADQYVRWTNEWLDGCQRVLKPSGSIYVAIGDEFAAEMGVALKKRLTMRNWLIWQYGFGQNQRKKFNRCKVHIFYFVKGEGFKWNPEEVKVPSARQLKYRDKRAKSGGKLPDDVWEFLSAEMEAEYDRQAEMLDSMPGGAQGVRPDMSGWDDLVNDYAAPNEVWKISRICGTFGERIKGEDGTAHPCQMPEAVLERIIKVSSDVGDMVLDPFGGSGTTAAVAKRLGRDYTTMDRSRNYCSVIAKRVEKDPDRFSIHPTL
jgi:DNA modification methylase